MGDLAGGGKTLKRIRHILEYFLVRSLVWIFSVLPLPCALRLGGFLGKVLFLLDEKHRHRAIENLSAAFRPRTAQDTIEEIARKVFENLGRTAAEFARIRTEGKRYVEQHVTIDGWENFLSARKKGKGVLSLSAHLGNWELGAVAIALKGYPMYSVARPLDNPYLEKMVNQIRSLSGNRVIAKGDALEEVLDLLRKGEIIVVLLDQNVTEREGVFVEFFGRPACTNKGPALIALRTGAPVLPVFIVREEGDRHRIMISKEIELVRTGHVKEDIRANTQLFTRIIESQVRAHPDQWLWVHRRWKTQP